MSASTNQPRTNQRRAKIVTNAAKLLQKIHDQSGEVHPSDRAMAGVLAAVLDKRKPH